MNNYTIFISSSDAYSDIWPVFFNLFKKYWPEYTGVIYLNTETETFQKDGLNIICTQVGKNQAFGTAFRKGLDMVDLDNVLLIMIDYIFMGKVIDNKIAEYYEFFLKNKLDSLCLAYQSYPNQSNSENSEIVIVTPPAPYIMFSYQIAFWNKSVLYEMALPHENPWTSEWYGTKRAEKMKIKLACLSKETSSPIPYDLAGCLHKGKWINEAISHLRSINYDVNFNQRGFYLELPTTIKTRIKVKWMLVKAGLRGSYWDLFTKRSLYK